MPQVVFETAPTKIYGPLNGKKISPKWDRQCASFPHTSSTRRRLQRSPNAGTRIPCL